MTDNKINSKAITVIRDDNNLSLLDNVQLCTFSAPSDSGYDSEKKQNIEDIYCNKFVNYNNRAEFSNLEHHFAELENVTEYNAELLARIIFVLYNTTAKYDCSITLPDITPQITAAPKPSATPRHTRGFKGTKDRRPTGKSTSALNVRKVLLDSQNLYTLLQKLWLYRSEATDLLNEWGVVIPNLSHIFRGSQPPKIIHLSLKYSNIPINEKTLISKSFNEEILPILSGYSWEIISKTLRVFYSYELDSDPVLRAAFCRTLFLTPYLDEVLDVLNQIPHLSRQNFLSTLVSINETKMPKDQCQFNCELISMINLINHEILEEHFFEWCFAIFFGLQQGHEPMHLHEYIKLSLEFYREGVKYHPLYTSHSSCYSECNAEVISSIVYGLPNDGNEYHSLILWENMSLLPNLNQVLKEALQLGFTEEQMDTYVSFFITPNHWGSNDDFPSWHTPETLKKFHKKWDVFQSYLPKIIHTIKALDEEYLDKWYDVLTDCICQLHDWSSVNITYCFNIAEKLSQPPFLNDSNSAQTISNFIEHSVQSKDVLSIPDNKLLIIDKACKRKNDGKIISWGLSVLSMFEFEFMFQALEHSPKKLVKAMKVIGPMSWDNRITVIKRFQKHPVFEADYNDLISKPDHLIQFVSEQGICEQYSPIPRALKEFFNGERKLSDTQVDRHLAKVQENLITFKLVALEDCAITFLKSNFDIQLNEKNIQYALKMYHSLDRDESKKPYKRFLKSYFKSGNATYIDKHPLTQSWINEHQNVDVSLWKHGLLDFRKQDLEFKIEQHPIEILKIGAYAGTCLGLGGIWTESAVAILLDINKQVLYARNEAGQVIARQIIAISDDDKMIAFNVYPLNVSKNIKRAFIEYNKKYSKALGLELFDGDYTKEYEIELILAQSWWDDSAWDFDLDGE